MFQNNPTGAYFVMSNTELLNDDVHLVELPYLAGYICFMVVIQK